MPTRRSILLGAGAISLAVLGRVGGAVAQESDPLPSWNKGVAKSAILELVATTTTSTSSNFVPEDERMATFDQDGTTWVEHPVYTELAFSLDRILELSSHHLEWKRTQPYSEVLQGNKSAIAALTNADWEKIVVATHAGMRVGEFSTITNAWMLKARDPRWHRPIRNSFADA